MGRSGRQICVVASGLLTLCLSAGVGLLAPSASHAIPSAGNYVFTTGFSGTFTSNGDHLTAWHINDSIAHIVWDSSSIVGLNDTSYFSLVDPSSSSSLTFLWANGFATETTGGLVRDFIPLSYQPSASVPETVIYWLLVAGLLSLLVYGWLQRRQTEAQGE
jgi:hypothetical protein